MGNHRRSRVRPILAAALTWAIVFVAFPTLTAEASCTAGQLVPTLGRWEINQGLGSYDRLTRGKDVLVRLYLTLPSTSTCSLGAGQAITIRAAALTVSNGSVNATGPAAVNAAGLATATLGLPPALTDSPHDPKFLVSGSTVISVAGGPSSFLASFSVQVTYDQKVSSTTTNTGLTATFTTNKTVDQQSKAIRILFQPIGDGSSTTAQFTDTDRAALQNAAQTLSRILPVPAGLGSLTPTGRSGGIRTATDPGLLDVRSITGAYKTVSGVTKFCATQSAYVSIAPLLGTRLDQFNAAQAADDAADYIVGVYSESISFDSANGCALGMATAPGKVTIARVVSDKPKSGATPAQVSYTGAVMAQEITHNLGGQPSPRSLTFHSSYVQSDATDPSGAYNLASGNFVSANKTVMNVDTSTSPWDNNVTLFEQLDYAYDLCRFGGTVLSGAECTTASPAGTLTGVAAIDSYVASGTTACGGNGLTEGYHATSAQTAADPASPYRLIAYKAGVQLGPDIGVPVTFKVTHGSTGDLGTGGLFTFALPGTLSDGRDEIKLVGPGGCTVFDVHAQTTTPTVNQVASDLAPGWSETLTHSVRPPRNPDGEIVFVADTTGSMGGAIANVRDNADTILTTILGQEPNARFAVANYKDFNNPTTCSPTSSYVYRLDQSMTTDQNAVKSAIGTWSASGGCDGPEAQLFALHQIATDPATGFGVESAQTLRAIAWFGDASGHNPSCQRDDTTGQCVGTSVTLDNAIADLTSQFIRVTAVSVGAGGLDACPSEVNGSFDPGLACPGQATRIANATGGVVKLNASADQVAQAIIDGLLSAKVEPHATCDPGVSISFEPTIRVVRSGSEDATFSETVSASTDAGGRSCTVDFYVNGKQVLFKGQPDPAFRQIITVPAAGAKLNVQAQATSGTLNTVADFVYHCAGTPFFPVATAVPASTTSGSGPFDLTFVTQIDPNMVPGGNCTLTAVVSDMFERSDPQDPNATTILNATTKPPRDVAIYTPTDGQQFGTRATVIATGGAADPEGGAISLAWTLTGPSSGTCVPAGCNSGNVQFAPTSGQWATGDYTLTLTGTDSDGSSTATRSFTVVADSALPQTYTFIGFFQPAKNWPDTNQVNGGQAFAPKWIFRDSSGQDVTTDGIFGARLQQVSCSTRAALGAPVFDWQVGATMIRYDTKGAQWVANVSIPAGIGLCYTWTLELKDGSLHPLFIQVVK